MFILSACQSRRDVVIPWESGINEVNYTHHNKQKASRVSLEWADDYCSYKGMDFVVVDRQQAYKNGLISQGADRHVRNAARIVDAVGQLPVPAEVIAESIVGQNSEKLLFRCVERK